MDYNSQINHGEFLFNTLHEGYFCSEEVTPLELHRRNSPQISGCREQLPTQSKAVGPFPTMCRWLLSSIPDPRLCQFIRRQRAFPVIAWCACASKNELPKRSTHSTVLRLRGHRPVDEVRLHHLAARVFFVASFSRGMKEKKCTTGCKSRRGLDEMAPCARCHFHLFPSTATNDMIDCSFFLLTSANVAEL